MEQLRDKPLCDIVMEGGITSGVIYPKAVVELAKKFRIKNIGGTSVGAIAAAATAAAELGRLRDPSGNPGYTRLAKLTDELSSKNPANKKTTKLHDLFQPQNETRPLFILLSALLNHKTKMGFGYGFIRGAVRAFPKYIFSAFLLPVVFALIFGHNDPFTWVITLLISLMATVAATVLAIWCTLQGPVVENGYGICTGYADDAIRLPPGHADEPLTLWLSRLLNGCAGKAPDGPPLTFGELWDGTGDAQSDPPEWLQQAGFTQWRRYIDLQMITTNVTHGRPYRFPFKDTDNDQSLYFKKADLERFFPPNVVQHMIQHASSVTGTSDILKLPDSRNLPVVFAARLSLSFPILLCAVPLYAMDYENPEKEKRAIKQCWFSDGGICSNFPIHLFDAPLPLWPTFGIKLEKELHYWPIKDDFNQISSISKDDAHRFFLPLTNEKGRGDSWSRFNEAGNGSKKMCGFITGLLDAARNWRDHTLTRAPGVRDRVVRVYLKDKEGGLNLNMEDNLIKGLASAGEAAAVLLSERFSPDSTDPMNFDNHRWMRLRNLAAVAEQDLESLHRAIAARPPQIRHWSDLIDGNTDLPGENQKIKLNTLIENLDILSMDVSTGPDMLEQAPRRTPVIRIVPDL
jgi:predicted acylesterase/phospholipase RssA